MYVETLQRAWKEDSNYTKYTWLLIGFFKPAQYIFINIRRDICETDCRKWTSVVYTVLVYRYISLSIDYLSYV